MVTRFGMSDLVGLMSVGDSDHEVFLGREITQKREISEHTAQLVDQEVKRTLDEAYELAQEVLERERELLDSIAQALLERETLDRGQVELLSQGDALPPLSSETDDSEEVPVEEPVSEVVPAGIETAADAPSEQEAPETEAEVGSPGPKEKAPVPSPAARLSTEEPDPDPSRG